MARTITYKDLKTYFGEEDHLEVSQQKSFPQMIFELLSEKTPTPEELKIFELILNLSIDHGPDTPSAVKVIEATNEGKTISEAVAEGIKQINDTHGGAMEPAMNFFYKIKSEKLDVKDLVSEYLTEHKLIGGFGHRIYKDEDPRATLILKYLKDLGFDQEYINLANQIQDAIAEVKGVKLPLNIDGAIAVVLCTFGWDSKLGKAVFIVARTPGLCGQYLNNLP